VEQIFCDTGKIAHLTYKDGKKSIASLGNRKKHQEYGLYKCPECHHFHVTTTSKKLRTPKRWDKYPLKVEQFIKVTPVVSVKKKKRKKPV